MFCMFGKCLFLAFIMAWNYSAFDRVLLQCVLIMAMGYFMETLLSLVCGNISKLQHDISSCLPTCFICIDLLCNFSWKVIIMTKGLHLIPIDFSTPHLKTVSKNFSIFHGEQVMVVCCRFTTNINFKMSVLCFVIIAIKKRQWCLECILKLEYFAETTLFLLCRDLLFGIQLPMLSSSTGSNIVPYSGAERCHLFQCKRPRRSNVVLIRQNVFNRGECMLITSPVEEAHSCMTNNA